MLTDEQIIMKWGGATKVAEMLKLPRNRGPYRVHNWKKRGIPAAIKMSHPWLAGDGPSAAQPKAAE